MNRIFIILLTLICLSGCSGERCIDADDFGFTNLTVSARYDNDELSEQFGSTQIAPWRDSNYKVNGRPLTIIVRTWEYGTEANDPTELSAWCAWYGTSGNKDTLSVFCERLQDCQFIDDQMCTNTTDTRIANAPCLFRNGVGLYALIATKGSDPNASFTSQRDPSGLSFHLGEKQDGYQLYDVSKTGESREAGGIIYKYDNEDESADALKSEFAGSSLYFKILDKFYDDNGGQYRISIKSGITNTNPDPLTKITELVKEYLFGVDDEDYGLVRSLYLGIVNNEGYRVSVSAMLILYIIFTSFSYLTGNMSITQAELMTRIGKIAIVSALLSTEYSWNFFNDYLFVYFIGGVEQILAIITEAGSSGPGASGILSLMIAPQTIAKISSLLFVQWDGFLYILVFFIALLFVMFVFLKATVLYLTALIAIGLIITLAPIFICFLLFGITRPFYLPDWSLSQ